MDEGASRGATDGLISSKGDTCELESRSFASVYAKLKEEEQQIEDVAKKPVQSTPVQLPVSTADSSAGQNKLSAAPGEGTCSGTKRDKTLLEMFGSRAETAAASKAPQPATKKPRTGRPLQSEGFKDVPGFETQNLRVAAKVSKKLPKTQSWCFVPLIFSALGRVPNHLVGPSISNEDQISAAQEVWGKFFSHWAVWRSELQRVITSLGAGQFAERFLPKTMDGKSWSTSLVYGEPKVYGKLPHPQGRHQDAILALLPCDVQNQIFASVMAITSDAA